MSELKLVLTELYEEFGLNETTLALSQILERYIVIAQREELDKCKYTGTTI